jgi:hypothetical protein
MQEFEADKVYMLLGDNVVCGNSANRAINSYILKCQFVDRFVSLTVVMSLLNIWLTVNKRMTSYVSSCDYCNGICYRRRV